MTSIYTNLYRELPGTLEHVGS
jgi:hypothetical protein